MNNTAHTLKESRTGNSPLIMHWISMMLFMMLLFVVLPPQSALALTASDSGGTVVCPDTANWGTSPSCTITPATGYHVYGVWVDSVEDATARNQSITGLNSSVAALYQLGNTTAPRAVEAKFRKNTYLVSAAVSGSGTNTVSTTTLASNYADYGTSATFLIDEINGFQLDSVTGDTACGAVTGVVWNDNPAPPTTHGTNATFTAASVTGPCTVTATFSADTTKPVTTFAVPASVITLTVPIITFTATDNVHVKEYCILQDNTNVNSCAWSGPTAPASFLMTGSEGLHRLYAWSRDYAGNISNMEFADITFDSANRINLPRSGQNRCYDGAGLSIACASTGQDGESQSGLAWPAVRFASGVGADATTAVVTDTLTGLMLPKDFNKVPTTQDWPTALATVAAMNAAAYAGYTDWRLPNRNEVASLVNRVRSDSASWLTTQGFLNVKPNAYWTGTTQTSAPAEAWSVNLLEGSVTSQLKSTANYVVPVRAWQGLGIAQPIQTGQTLCYKTTDNTTTACVDPTTGVHTGQDGDQKAGIPWPTARFGNVDGTTPVSGSIALDRLTGLMWQVAAGDSGVLTWQAALTYIQGLNTAQYLGYSDWRLANSVELQSLYNGSVTSGKTWLEGQGFSNIQATGYWTGTTDINKAKNAWVYNCDSGNLTYSDKVTTSFHALAVRGGLIGSGSIAVTPANPDLGQQAYGSASAKQEITISNSGASELQISSITLDNSNDGAFAIDVSYGGKPCASYAPALSVGDFCTIGLAFTPVTAGNKAATLTITNSDSIRPALDVQLIGAGVSTVSGVFPGGHGTVVCPGTAVSGGSSICAITPEVGYHLISLTDTATSNPVGNVYSGISQTSYTVTNITINRTVTAGFAIDTFAPGVAIVGAGSLSCSTANYGTASSCTVAPTDPASHHLVNLTDNGIDVTSAVVGTVYSIANVTAAHNLIATFELNTYSVTATSNGNGSINCVPSVVNHGSASTCSMATTLPGHHLNSLTDNGVAKTATGSGPYSYVISAVTVPHVVAADFAINQYTVTIPVAANGTSVPANSTVVPYKSTVAVTFTPAANYRLISASGCGGVLAGNQFTLDPVIADCTLTSAYERITHQVSVAATAGGTVTPYTTQTVNQGDTQAFTIVPSAGFTLTEVSGCGITATSGSTYTTAANAGDCTVSIGFSDGQAPVISAFALPLSGSTLTVPIALFTVTDNAAVTGWYISDSAVRPVPTAWLNSSPASYALAATQPDGSLTPAGEKTLYAWVRDAAGNVSNVGSASTTITFPAPIRLIQTGQEACYDGSGSILCSATAETQDGKIKAGLAWSAPNFNNNGDTTLTDTTTGLMWSQTGNVIYTRSSYSTYPGTIDWQGALDYVKTINAEWFSGYQDWRLPNRNELLSLMSFGVAGGLYDRLTGLTPTPFIDVPETPLYWSSTSASAPAHAYQLTNDGTLFAADKATAAYLIVVRTPKADPANDNFGYVAPRTSLLATGQTLCSDAVGANRDCINGSGVITGEDGATQSGMPFTSPRFVTDNGTTIDQSTGLTWLDSGNAPACGAFVAGTVKSFSDALAYIGCLNTNFYAGKADWRLPNLLELSSLVNASQISNASWLNSTFSAVQTADYWSSDSAATANPAVNAYSVNLDSYAVSIGSKAAVHNVLPVRGGYIAIPGRAFSLSTNAVSFGTVPGRTTSDQIVFTITNDAGVELNISGTTVSGNGTMFKHDPTGGSSPCNTDAFVLPVGGSCTMSVAFTAAQAGPQTATLTVTGATSSEILELSAIGGPNSYAVTVTPAVGGVVACTPVTVAENGTSTCTITADAGKRLAAFSDNAVDRLSAVVGNSYSITSIAADHMIAATFAITTYTVSTQKTGNGTISAGGTIDYNTNTAITVTPDVGQHISSVNGCNGTLVNNTYTTGPITADCTVAALFAADPLAFTATSTGNGTIACLPTPASYGDTVTCTMTPATGYKVSALTDNAASVFASVVGNQYMLSSITAIHTLTSGFALKQYTVTPAISAGGTITPAVAQTLNHGSTTQFTATASTGYHLVDFTAGTTCPGSISGAVFTSTAITSDCTVQANFARNSYNVTAAKTGNGSIVTEGTQQALHGDTVSFAVTPANGSHLVSIIGCGVNLTYAGNSQTAAVTAITESITTLCSIDATFALNNYSITASTTGSGTISPSGTQPVTFGNSIAFTLAPVAGQNIKDVTGSCGGTLVGTTFTTAAAGSDCTVIANYIPQTFALSTNSGVNKVTFNPTAVATAPYGSVQSFQLTADIGYTVAVATGCNGTLSSAVAGVYTYTTGAITQACDIIATPLANSYTVTLSPGANGSLAGATSTGTTDTVLTFTASPATGYHLATVSGCGATFTSGTTTITTAPLSAYCTLSATFAANHYTVSTSGANVTFNPTVRTGMSHGATTTFEITPVISYNITGVSGCGGSWDGASGIFTTGALSGDCTVSAATTIKTFAVASPGSIANGSISCTTPVGYNTTSVCTITPQVGYHLASFTVGGVNMLAQVSNNAYNIANVIAAQTVTGSFAIDTFTVTATAGANGTVTPGASYNYGDSPQYNVTPVTGYHIVSVLVDGASQSIGNPKSFGTTFSSISASHTITATFAIDIFTIGSSLTGNGSIVCLPATVNHGGSSVCTIAPTAGNKLTEITDNGSSVYNLATMKNGGTYTISAISANHAIVGTFVAYQYKVTASATGNGGSLTPVSVVYGDAGDTPAFKLVQYDGYQINPRIDTCGSTTTGTQNPFDLVVEPLTKNCDLTFTFIPISGYFEMLTSAGTGGSITPIAAVFPSGSKTITVTPNSGYHIISVTVDGVAQTLTDLKTFSVSFTSITAGHAVNALFAADKNDFNADGKTDLVWRHSVTGNNMVWNMNGTAIKNLVAVQQLADPNWQISATGDFNNDGKSDIVWRNKLTGSNMIWQMNGTTLGTQTSIQTVPDQNWQMYGAGTFNGDGKTTLLWRHLTTGNNMMWTMNGTAIETLAAVQPVPDQNWQIAGIGDFDGDNKSDIVWRHKTTGNNMVWKMNGSAIKSLSALPAEPDLNWLIATVGDFNNDGKADIVWRNKVTGENRVWYMDGTTKTGTSAIQTVPDQNWQIVGR